MTQLRFSGDIGTLQGIVLALLVGAAAWFLYRRQVRHRDRATSVILPTLRAVAVFLLVMMLTQPVLHHREVIGELGRLLVVIDGSRSLTVKDPDAKVSRKILAARATGGLAASFVDEDLVGTADDLERQYRRLAFVINHNAPIQTLQESTRAYGKVMKTALRQVKSLKTAAIESTSPTGSITQETWFNVGGDKIAQLTSSAAFRKPADKRMELKTFESPKNVADNYGARLSGYIHPPEDGLYTFWIYGDDESKLFLSTSNRGQDAKPVAWVNSYTTYRQWDAFKEQKTQPIQLKAGKRYYVEVLFKESAGDDFVGVGWQRPNGQMERPIPGKYLEPMPQTSRQSATQFAAAAATRLQKVAELENEPNRSKVIPVIRQSLKDGETALTLLRAHIDSEMRKLAATGQPDISRSIKEFDQRSRWQRLQAALFDGKSPLIQEIAAKHEVELVALKGDKAELLWRSKSNALGASKEVPAFLAATPVEDVTDLTAALNVEKTGQRTAILLISDGQHNHGPSPLERAKILGQKGIKVHTVGLGALRPPQDLAIRKVRGPESIYVKDMAHGTIAFVDRMDAGKPFTISIKYGAETLWEKSLVTDGSGPRAVDFELAVEDQVQRTLAKAGKGLKYGAVPMELNVQIADIKGDRQLKNNHEIYNLQVATRRRRVLLVDQRPRWEWRYLKSMLRRDTRWEVNCVLPVEQGESMAFRHGKSDGALPENLEEWLGYDLVILGDVPKRMLNEADQTFLTEFVTVRGGGLILVDGRRLNMRTLKGSKFDALLPITWNEGQDLRNAGRFELTPAGKRIAALDLGNEKRPNDETWARMPAAHWAAAVTPLPGAETLVLMKTGAKTQSPLLVFRRCGSGKVLYCATADLWRWRYRKGNEHHQRFWYQVADWIMERPYSVEDNYVSIDAGPPTYNEGQSAELRIRLREKNGKPMLKAKAEAVLMRNSKIVALIPLAEDAGTGTYRATTAELSPGKYQVRVKVEGVDDDRIKAKAEFLVQKPKTAELAELECNEKLLQEIALSSGGEYYREEQIRQVLDALAPLSSGKVVETDTALWQSYWYFAIVVLLFTIEWIWRKKRGLL